MALAVDATSTKNTGASPSSNPSWSHTCTGSNLALFIGVGWSTASVTVSSVTYNGVALTQVGTTATNSTGNAAIYRLIAPATGAHTAQVTFSGTASAWMWGISFTGADQTSPEDGTNNNTGSTSPVSTAVTPTADGDYIIDMGVFLSNFSITVNSNQTQVLNLFNSSNATTGIGSYHTNPISPAASTTMQWTFSGTKSWAQTVAAVRPVQLASLSINVSDSTSTSESINVNIPLPSILISVSDSTTTTESLTTPAIVFGIAVTLGLPYLINGVKIV